MIHLLFCCSLYQTARVSGALQCVTGKTSNKVTQVKESMDLQRLYWTKNVKPDQGWAYCEFKPKRLFKLAWKKDENNANSPERNDLILLRQHGYVTHLVKVLDYKAEHEDWEGDFNLYRIVEVVWAVNSANPPTSASANVIFGYSAVLDYQGGNVMKLERLQTFRDAWDSQGGISAFQKFVQARLDDVKVGQLLSVSGQ